MVKIEKFSVVSVIEVIVECVDVIMVVCGDFGVEVLVESVLGIQKCIVQVCCQFGKLVVVVIQMFELMCFFFVLICVEVIDVVIVVGVGVDVVMFLVEIVFG